MNIKRFFMKVNPNLLCDISVIRISTGILRRVFRFVFLLLVVSFNPEQVSIFTLVLAMR